MIFRRIASICFAITFLLAIVLFTQVGAQYIPRFVAKFGFLFFGAIGLVLNLLAFRFDKSNVGFNFIYWLGSIILFIGLTFMIMHWPYSFYIILVGLAVVGVSFFITPKMSEESKNDEDLLDDSL